MFRNTQKCAILFAVWLVGCGGGHGVTVPPVSSETSDAGVTAPAPDAGGKSSAVAHPVGSGTQGTSSDSEAGSDSGSGSESGSEASLDAAPPPALRDGATSCSGLAAQAQGDTTWTISTSSGARAALVHIPPGYDPTAPTAVVLNFHGYAGNDAQEESLTLMDTEADSQNFVVVYPQGTGPLPSWNAGACCGTATEDNVDDVGFVNDLLDQLEATLCVDPSRVFVTGMSNGGFFSHKLGCVLANRVAAIAPVAGVMGIPVCTPSRPVPIIEFHGTADPLVPYDGDPAIGYPSVATTIAGWVQRDGCTGEPVQTYQNGDATCMTYEQCMQGAEVTLCTIQGGGHTWPGGTPFPLLGATSTDISATDAMWTFFQAHPMP